MHWPTILSKVEHLRSLSEAEAAAYLAQLRTEAPEIATTVERLGRPARNADTFMRTAAEDGAPEHTPALAIGDQVGVWRITAFLGAGGMGEVYQASRADGLYEQVAALKVMHGQLSPTRAGAFERERKRLARLDSPGVSRIIDGGTADDGQPFMVMEYVDGRPIDQYCQATNLPVAARLGLVADLGRAVSHAHARLVLHRDIKASNALVTGQGDVKLIDFGIASLLEEDATASAGPMTLATAAPEQLLGEPVSVATDVFALGMLAHELVTGRLPTRRGDAGVELDRPGLANTDLAAILARATATDADARYPSAEAFTEDIRAFLERRPVAAREGGGVYRTIRFLQRYPVASVLGTIAVGALAAGLAVSLAFGHRVTLEAERASLEAERANAELVRAEYFLERAERFADIESAYLVIFGRAFSEPGERARFRQILFDRVNEAYASKDESPQRAAQIILAVGRHLVYWLDYYSAMTVLQPWLAEGFGDRELINLGKLSLATAYRNVGRADEALVILKELEQAYSDPNGRLALERVWALSEIAAITVDDGDINRATVLLEDAVEVTETSFEISFYYFFLVNFAQIQGDFDRSYDYAKAVVTFLESDPLVDRNLINIHRAQLGLLEYYHRNDVDSARTRLDQVIAEAAAHEGFTLQSAQVIRADIAAHDGDFALAEDLLDRSRRGLFLTFGQERPARGRLVEHLAMQGEFERATTELTELVRLTHGIMGPSPGNPDPNLVLAAAHLGTLQYGPEAGAEAFEVFGYSTEWEHTDPGHRYRVNRLRAMGVAIPEAAIGVSLEP